MIPRLGPARAGGARAALVACVAVSLLALASCKASAKKDNALPPPTGSAVLPPDIPVLPSAGDGPASSAAGGDQEGFRGTGTLGPREEAQLGPKASGVLAAITVDEGDRVKKGQLLFRLESRQAGLAVEQAKAGLSSAKIAKAAAELDYQRTKELEERGSVAPALYDQAKARYDGAKAGVEQAEVALSMAKKMASDTAVFSPLTGVVTMRLKSVGETVTMMPPTIVLVVQDLSKLELRAKLPERALSRLEVGEPLELRFPALDLRRTVPVTRIMPTVDPRSRSVEVVAEMDNADGALRPGMLVEVSVDAGKAVAAPAPGQSAPKVSEKRP